MRLLKILVVCLIASLATPAAAQEAKQPEKKTEEKAKDKKSEETKTDEKKPEEKKAEEKKAEEKKAEEKKAEEKKAEEKKAEEKKAEEKKPEPEEKSKTEEKKPEKKPEKKAEEKKPEKKPEAKKPAEKGIEASSEEVLTGLYNPCGVAIQPETGHVFVADSGNLRVVRFDPAADEVEMEEVITGFPQDVYGKGPKYDIGPLGLAFLDKDTLVVGGGGKPDGEELLRVYKVPEAGSSITADEMLHELGPIGPGEQSKKGEGNFYGVAIGNGAIYVTCNGDDTKGWVSRSVIEDGKPGEFAPYIATKPKVNVDAPVGITLHPSRGLIVIGQSGEINKPLDSLLTFYNPSDGSLMLSLECDLHDVVALAYSPREKPRMYALDFAWMDAPAGGLFRLDKTISEEGKQGCKPVPVLPLDKPTAMTFDKDGNLYVTVIGTAEEGAEEKPGKLLRIQGDL